MSPLEVVAAILGVINIALLVRRSIWNYPFGIVMVTLYGFVFFQARLYSDAILQIYFFLVQIYGWWNWLHSRDEAGLARVETMSSRERILFGVATVIVAIALGWAFATFTNAAAPWMDASLAATSVTAQYLLSIRKIENWTLWIAADVIYVGLYIWKGLYPTAALYVIFLVFSIAGLLEWRRQLRTHATAFALQVTPP